MLKDERFLVVVEGDSREVLRDVVKPNTLDAIVADPPYEINFRGHAWDRSGVAFDIDFWRTCFDALKPGGHLLAFSFPRVYHRVGCAVEDAGFEIRDMVEWVYSQGMPKSRRTLLKPAHEPIVFARKPLRSTLSNNALLYGTGALRAEECRTKDGRFPSNLIWDGSPEVAALFPDAPGQQGDLRAQCKTTNGLYGEMPPRHEALMRGDAGSAARFFYCAKATKRDRGADNDHPTVKPTELMRMLCRLVTPLDGLICDPFLGSGSTGKAAMLEGLRFIGIEQDAAYAELSRKRIRAALDSVSARNHKC